MLQVNNLQNRQYPSKIKQSFGIPAIPGAKICVSVSSSTNTEASDHGESFSKPSDSLQPWSAHPQAWGQQTGIYKDDNMSQQKERIYQCVNEHLQSI